MHTLYFVVKKHENNLNRDLVRELAVDFLDENHFTSYQTLWGGSKNDCDWFTVGGRWSGILTEEIGTPVGNIQYGILEDCRRLDKDLIEKIERAVFGGMKAVLGGMNGICRHRGKTRI